MTETVLPINRGRVVPKIASKIGIDLEDTSWMDEPFPELAPWEPRWLWLPVWMQRHEFKVWVFITLALVFYL